MEIEPNGVPIVDNNPWVDLREYDQSWYDRGRPGWYVLLWWFTYPWKVEIGDYSWVGDDVVFYSLEIIKIGSQSVISQKSYLCTGSHDFRDPTFNLIVKPITIGNGVWVATDCFIAPGVKIASNAVIGARSSVFKHIPAAMVAWGSPCKPHYLRKMNSEGSSEFGVRSSEFGVMIFTSLCRLTLFKGS